MADHLRRWKPRASRAVPDSRYVGNRYGITVRVPCVGEVERHDLYDGGYIIEERQQRPGSTFVVRRAIACSDEYGTVRMLGDHDLTSADLEPFVRAFSDLLEGPADERF